MLAALCILMCAHWTPELALAVVELLDDRVARIWANQALAVSDVLRAKRGSSRELLPAVNRTADDRLR